MSISTSMGKASEHLSKSLIIYNETVPNDHPSPAQVFYNMDSLYHALGNID